MHHKYVVRDGGTPTGAVWTGSTNFTDDSWRLQENNIVRLDSPELCPTMRPTSANCGRRATSPRPAPATWGRSRSAASRSRSPFRRARGGHRPGRGPPDPRRPPAAAALLHAAHVRRHPRRRCRRARPARPAEFGGVYDETQMERNGQWKAGPRPGKSRYSGDVAAHWRASGPAVHADEQTRFHAQQGRGGRRRGGDRQPQPVAQRHGERGKPLGDPGRQVGGLTATTSTGWSRAPAKGRDAIAEAILQKHLQFLI